MIESFHAAIRAQQRCIPPLVGAWLEEYGEEEHDGSGGVILFFSHQSIRTMERVLGRQIVSHNSKYFRAYKVISSHDGVTITTGWRTRHIRRH